MKKKILVSTLIILVVVAASLGATMAWFTDQSDPIENTFTAGTVEIKADESWAVGHTHRNWNPGDCTGKEIKVRVVGTKRVFIRADIEEKWFNLKALDLNGNVLLDSMGNPVLASPTSYVYYDGRTAPNIKWQIKKTDLANPSEFVYADWPANQWQQVGSHWYYSGILTPSGSIPAGISEILVTSRVCLDGPGTSNAYQGASYKLNIDFEAIQVTHEAAFLQWGAGFHVDKWYPVVLEGAAGNNTIYLQGGVWKLQLPGQVLTWRTTAGQSDPNVKSFQP